MLLVQAILGIAAFIGIAMLFSSNFRRVNWKLVGFAIALVALVDATIGLLPDVGGAPLTMERIGGWRFAPVAWL